jgi:uncharacterized protein (TIGR02646 family)
MRSVSKRPHPVGETGEAMVFTDYTQAKPHLEKRLGRYCSYCERPIPCNLAVEHKRPQAHHPELALSWGNLLLGCGNCNGTKSDQNPQPGAVVWPDEDDTFALITYCRSGMVKPKTGLDVNLFNRVNTTLTMLGLSKIPEQAANSDHRYADRLEVWHIAEQSRVDLQGQNTPELRRSILETAKAKGGYSIWQTVFADDPAMQQALACAFPGTRTSTSPD